MRKPISVLPSKLDLGATWVHFQHPQANTIEFGISIPDELVEQVFGPVTISTSLPLSQQIKENIETLGTFVADGYIEEIGKLLGVKRKPYEWVIIGIDNVEEFQGTIKLIGRAVKFDSSKYN